MRPLQLQRFGILDGGDEVLFVELETWPYNYNDSGSSMAEGVGIRSRTEEGSVLPLGGQAPSRRRVAPVTP